VLFVALKGVLMPEYLTTEEVARRYRTSTKNARRWQTEGYGPKAIKIGRRWLYPTEEVDRFEAQLATQAD
jgi:predicted site-specific integrase-resolvase